MTYRIVLRPDGNLGAFDDATGTWADQALMVDDEDVVDLLWGTEGIDPDEAREIIGQVRAGKLDQVHGDHVMAWEEAAWLAQPEGSRTGSRPLRQDKKGDRIWKHGLSGYARGCRCDVCMRREGGEGFTHGLGPTGKPSGYAQGCRCEVCTDAKAAYERGKSGNPRSKPRPPMLDPRDLRDRNIKVSVSAAEESLIFELALEDGMAASTWIMEKFVLPELEKRTGYVSPRRPAPRRPNREPRPRAKGAQQREEGQQ